MFPKRFLLSTSRDYISKTFLTINEICTTWSLKELDKPPQSKVQNIYLRKRNTKI